MGTTSACAENTATLCLPSIPIGNYLRVRGEYERIHEVILSQWELPPRARRIPPQGPPLNHHMGTTSACAENTISVTVMIKTWGNYLRVRGEYSHTHPT